MRLWTPILLLVLLASGCIAPFRAHVDPDVVEGSGMEWRLVEEPVQEGTLLEAATAENRYSFTPGAAEQPPYPGVLQVFSVRQPSITSSTDMASALRDLVDGAIAREGIATRPELKTEGERTLARGQQTAYFTRGGTVDSGDGFFARDAEVRILGESWYDTQSEVTVLVVALAKVGEQGFVAAQEDMRTWRTIAGDPEGTVLQAVHQNGFVYQMVSHD